MYRVGFGQNDEPEVVNPVTLDALVKQVAQSYNQQSVARFAINDFRDALHVNGYVIVKES